MNCHTRGGGGGQNQKCDICHTFFFSTLMASLSVIIIYYIIFFSTLTLSLIKLQMIDNYHVISFIPVKNLPELFNQ